MQLRHILSRSSILSQQQRLLSTSLLSPSSLHYLCICCGLLYHLPKPWEFLNRLPSVAPILYLWTAYCGDREAIDLPNGMRGKIHGEGGLDEPLSGLSPTATWLTLDCLLACLAAAGYKQVEVIQDEPNHVNGCMVTIGARLRAE